VAERRQCLASAMSISLGSSGGAMCLFIEVVRGSSSSPGRHGNW
jgi:hypothetical protein